MFTHRVSRMAAAKATPIVIEIEDRVDKGVRQPELVANCIGVAIRGARHLPTAETATSAFGMRG